MSEVSVVIPVFNAASFLSETIDSVLCQTFPDFELILVDDGSTDHSMDIIQSYKDPRIHSILCSHDFVGTVNRGYAFAKSKYIAQLDHDDLMIPERLEIQYKFMESNPNIVACGGWMHCFGKRTHVIRMPKEHDQIMLSMLLHGPILNPTGFVRKQFLMEHQIKHQYEYSFYSDVKFWSEVAKKGGKLANIPQVLTLYRTSDEQATEKILPQCREILNRIKLEMLEYFLSCMKKDEKLAQVVEKDLMPAIEEIGELGFFSDDVFFRFMFELIGGLLKRSVIEL